MGNRSIFRGMVFTLVLIGIAGGLAMAAGGASDPASAYVSPDLSKVLFDTTQLKMGTRMQGANLLASAVVNELKYENAKDYERATRFLGIALRLHSTNRAAVIANGMLRRGQKPTAGEEKWDHPQFIKDLGQLAHECSISTVAAEKALSVYLFDVLLEVDPTNQNAVFDFEQLRQGGLQPDWSWADPKAAAALALNGTPTTQPTSRPAGSIVDPAYADKPKSFARTQCVIKGLNVRTLTGGTMLGFASDILLTVIPASSNMPAGARRTVYRTSDGYVQANAYSDGFRIVGSVGDNMNISFEEAQRAVRLRYPLWAQASGEISFQDNYTPKDGGSAGTAFCLLLLSALEGFEIDKSFAITGDITSDWKVRPIGGVAAKIRGAATDGCKYVAIPADNVAQLDDLFVLTGEKTFWDIHIFSVATLDEAQGLLRTDRSEDLKKAIALFSELQAEHASASKVYRKPAGVAKLKQIVALAPNHLSARYLLKIIDGKAPETLSITGSLFESLMAAGPFRRNLMGATWREEPAGDLESSRTSIQRLRTLRKIAHKDVVPVIEAIGNFIMVVTEVNANREPNVAWDDGESMSMYRIRSDTAAERIRTARRSVFNAFERLQANPEAMAKLYREGI